MEAHLVGNDEHQHVEPWFQQRFRDRPIQREPGGIKGTEGRDGEEVSGLVRQAIIHDTNGLTVDIITDLKANPIGIEGRHLVPLIASVSEEGTRC